jgi:tRNA nucleotidyltransferase/poly(A) polymerase
MERTARAIAERLREHVHIVYFAGGCVRDVALVEVYNLH